MKTTKEISNASETLEGIITRLATERAKEIKPTEDDLDRIASAIEEVRESGGVVYLEKDGTIGRSRELCDGDYPLITDEAAGIMTEGTPAEWAESLIEEFDYDCLEGLIEKLKGDEEICNEARTEFWEAVGTRFAELAKGTPAEEEEYPSDCELDGDTVEEQARAGLKHVVLGDREEITVAEACEKAKEIGGSFGSTIKESEEAGERYYWNEQREELLCIAPVQGAISMLSRERILAGWEGYLDPAPSKETIAALL